MRNFCSQITPGMQRNEMYKLIEQTHYKILQHDKADNRIITIVDAKAMGRFICAVTLHQDKVIVARYVYND